MKPILPVIFLNSGIPEDKKIKFSLFDLLWKVFDYEDVDAENVEFFVVDDPGRGFPFRARFKKPIQNLLYPNFYRSPNFPDLYVHKDGTVHSESMMGARMRGRESVNDDRKLLDPGYKDPVYYDYIETTVPCAYHPKFVSHFRIYADVWGNFRPERRDHHFPVPKNGVWTDLRPANVKWRKRVNNQLMFEQNIVRDIMFPKKDVMTALADWDGLCEYLNKRESSFDRFGQSAYDASIEGDFKDWINIRTNSYGNNIDYCYAPYWFVIIADCLTGNVEVAWDINTARRIAEHAGVMLSRNDIRRIPYSTPSVTLRP